MTHPYPNPNRTDPVLYAMGSAGLGDTVSDPQQMLRAFRRRLPLFLVTVISTFMAVA